MKDWNKLKELAQDAKWTGRWYNSGCNTVMCDYDGKDDHDEVAHPVPIGIADYIAAVHPAAVLGLIDELESVTAERDQLREANASRSDKLNEAQSIIDQLRAEAERLRMQLAACGVVAMSNTPESAAKARDMHPDYMSASCQDVMRVVDREIALRAEVEALRNLLPDDDIRHLRRFQEICEDTDADGHDLPKEAVRRLERAGALRSCGFGRHETTLFGDAILAAMAAKEGE